jgi:methyl-accepting chemotaxis protein
VEGAAHTGGAGRGFVVAAGKIRKPAESSSVQAENVAGAFKKMRESLIKINNSTGVVAGRLPNSSFFVPILFS